MNQFTALVVDDEKEVLRSFLEEFAGTTSLKLLTADSVSAALDLIKRNFLHVALVDMHLNSSTANAMPVFKLLSEERPTCKTYLFTQYPNKVKIFRLLDPRYPQIHGAIDKQGFSTDWTQVVSDLSGLWLQSVIEVNGTAIVRTGLAARAVRTPLVETTEEEIDYVVSSLLGQTRERRESSEFDINRIDLELLSGGKSTSVVARGQPQNRAGQKGVWCVIKFSPKADARAEFERYCRYVRFIVTLSYRVELLGYVEGDTIGAMCYSFAGPSPEKIVSLNSLFGIESEEAFGTLQTLFDVRSRFWYGVDGNPTKLANHFYNSYRLEPSDLIQRVRKLTEEMAGRLPGARLNDGELLVSGDKLLSPEHAVGSPSMRVQSKTTIAHGDMNAENVICSGDGRVILIDYRYAGFNPRTVDFAALECSIRLSQPGTDEVAAMKAHRVEAVVWKEVWGRSEVESESRLTEYWSRLSRAIGGHARSNFEDLLPKEYAATCLLWALRIFRVADLTTIQRFRLLVWSSHLTRVLSSD